jgi:hypothetical protein
MGDLDVSGTMFTVAKATGNTAVAGTLDVTGATTLSNTLDVTGATTLTGTLDASCSTIAIGRSGSSIGFFGASNVVQQNTTNTISGHITGSGNNVSHDDTFTGGTGGGTPAYTIGDIVRALKQYGLLAA